MDNKPKHVLLTNKNMHAIVQDPALDNLTNKIFAKSLTSDSSNGLLLLDEQPLTAQQLQRLQTVTNLDIISNRYEQVQAAKKTGLNAVFNDFEFPDKYYDFIAYRISKEKAVIHHIIQQAGQHLISSGQLLLSGYKQEGIKTAIKSAEQYFNCKAIIQRDKKQLSLANISLRQLHEEQSPPMAGDYLNMQPLAFDINGNQPYSKAGQFGWKQIDPGSKLLVEQLQLMQADGNNLLPIKKHSRVLDLGCGYGYLALNALAYQPKSVTLTDNCAAAIASAQFNIDNYRRKMVCETEIKVVAADIGDLLKPAFDVILCNPPFHQGFKVSHQLTQRFLQATKRLLAPSATALFVVNEFIAIEAAAEQESLHWQLRCKSSGFKVGLVHKKTQ